MKEARAISENCFALQGEALGAFSAGSADLTEVEVILSGDYKARGFVIDEKAIDQMIANHARAGVDPAVDREHESWSALKIQPSPAMGWVKRLSKRPSSADAARMALVAHVEWTDVGGAALSQKHYRYVSAGLDLKARDRRSNDPIGVMLDHVALVKHPFVQGMQPLSLAAEPTKEKTMKLTLHALGLTDEATDEQAHAALTSQIAEKDAALKTATDAHAALETEVKASRLAKLAADLDAKIAAFAVDPAEKVELLALAEKDPAMFGKLLALRQPRDPSGPKLDTPKVSGVNRAALQEKSISDFLAANKNKDYSEALVACAAANPELFNEVA